jgi:hypothetical protein
MIKFSFTLNVHFNVPKFVVIFEFRVRHFARQIMAVVFSQWNPFQ